jgi:hypothetical protein
MISVGNTSLFEKDEEENSSRWRERKHKIEKKQNARNIRNKAVQTFCLCLRKIEK